ncbi:hypothetical protein D3C81_1188660 [compost metagenome]
MRRQAFGGQACCLGYAQVSRIPALAMQSQRRVGILGHGFHGEASNRVHCGAPQHGTRATEEGGIPHVVAVLHQAVEQLAFVGTTAEHVEVALEGVRRQEVVRGLHQRQLRITQEPAYRELQEGTHRHVVAVENRDQFAVGQAQCMVEVTGLGMVVVAAHDVADTHLVGKLAKFIALAIVEDIDTQFVLWPVDPQGGVNRTAHHRQVFVVRRDQQIDRRPQCRVGRQLHGLAVKRPARLDVAEDQHHP